MEKGDQVSHCDQLETVVNGLPPEYQVLTLSIKYHDELCAFVVAKMMLLSHETKLELTPHDASQDYISLNLIQGIITPGVNYTVSTLFESNTHEPQFEQSRGGRGD